MLHAYKLMTAENESKFQSLHEVKCHHVVYNYMQSIYTTLNVASRGL